MKKLSYYRPAIAAFLAMMTMSLQSTGLSFFITPVSEALGVGRGSFTLYISLMTLANAFAAPFLGRFAGKKGVRPILIFSSVWATAGMWLFSFSTQLWMFYVIAIAVGAGMSGCVMLCANVILQKSYDARASAGLMGIVMAGSGVGGIILSQIVPRLLETLGWRMCYRILGTCWLVMCVLAVVIMGKEAPPLTTKKPVTGAPDAKSTGLMKDPRLYLLILEMVCLAAACAINQNLPSVLGSMGLDTAQVSTMMSLLTFALALGKILQGKLYQSAGNRVGGSITIALFAVGMLMLPQQALLYPAVICSAIGLGVYTTLMPLVTRATVGNENFAAVWGILQASASISLAIATPLWGTVYDLRGSYALVLAANAVLLAVGFGANWVLTRGEKR